jgi:5-methylcytosine-specific restriction endonuclease McrA
LQDIEQLRELDNDNLLRSLKRHVGSSNRLNALVLAHLAEVDARGAYRDWACDTLAAYCIYELRLSEDEAQRRCRAARVAREFPVLFGMLADASIHLTGILLLAPYLTEENHREVLARARYRRKREIERLVAELAPARDVPALVEPLRPAVHRGLAPSTWASLIAGNEGWVRHLKTGDGPAQAPSAHDGWHEALATTLGDVQSEPPAVEASSEGSDAPAREASKDSSLQPLPGAPPTPALRYRVQFSADQAYVDLLERARDLLWHQLPHGDLAALQRLALEALVEKLMTRKCGTPRTKAESQPRNVPRHDVVVPECDAPARSELLVDAAPARSDSLRNAPARSDSNAEASPAPARSSRHIPAAVRRQVWQRDGGRCTFSDARGVRCRATRAIEFHHERPYALGGPHCAENITLRCRSHNELAAERDFGRELVRAMKHASDGP